MNSIYRYFLVICSLALINQSIANITYVVKQGTNQSVVLPSMDAKCQIDWGDGTIEEYSPKNFNYTWSDPYGSTSVWDAKYYPYPSHSYQNTDVEHTVTIADGDKVSVIGVGNDDFQTYMQIRQEFETESNIDVTQQMFETYRQFASKSIVRVLSYGFASTLGDWFCSDSSTLDAIFIGENIKRIGIEAFKNTSPSEIDMRKNVIGWENVEDTIKLHKLKKIRCDVQKCFSKLEYQTSNLRLDEIDLRNNPYGDFKILTSLNREVSMDVQNLISSKMTNVLDLSKIVGYIPTRIGRLVIQPNTTDIIMPYGSLLVEEFDIQSGNQHFSTVKTEDGLDTFLVKDGTELIKWSPEVAVSNGMVYTKRAIIGKPHKIPTQLDKLGVGCLAMGTIPYAEIDGLASPVIGTLDLCNLTNITPNIGLTSRQYDVSIPSYFKSKILINPTSIQENSFSADLRFDNGSILVVGDKIQNIGKGAFRYCPYDIKISFNNVTNIDDDAFFAANILNIQTNAQKTAVSLVYLRKCVSIGDMAFQELNNSVSPDIDTVVVAENVLNYGINVFSYANVKRFFISDHFTDKERYTSMFFDTKAKEIYFNQVSGIGGTRFTFTPEEYRQTFYNIYNRPQSLDPSDVRVITFPRIVDPESLVNAITSQGGLSNDRNTVFVCAVKKEEVDGIINSVNSPATYILAGANYNLIKNLQEQYQMEGNDRLVNALSNYSVVFKFEFRPTWNQLLGHGDISPSFTGSSYSGAIEMNDFCKGYFDYWVPPYLCGSVDGVKSQFFKIIGVSALSFVSDEKKDSVAKCTHNYKTEYIAASCVEDGYISKKCSKCGDGSRILLPAKGHVLNPYDFKYPYSRNCIDTAKQEDTRILCQNCGAGYNIKWEEEPLCTDSPKKHTDMFIWDWYKKPNCSRTFNNTYGIYYARCGHCGMDCGENKKQFIDPTQIKIFNHTPETLILGKDKYREFYDKYKVALTNPNLSPWAFAYQPWIQQRKFAQTKNKNVLWYSWGIPQENGLELAATYYAYVNCVDKHKYNPQLFVYDQLSPQTLGQFTKMEFKQANDSDGEPIYIQNLTSPGFWSSPGKWAILSNNFEQHNLDMTDVEIQLLEDGKDAKYIQMKSSGNQTELMSYVKSQILSFEKQPEIKNDMSLLDAPTTLSDMINRYNWQEKYHIIESPTIERQGSYWFKCAYCDGVFTNKLDKLQTQNLPGNPDEGGVWHVQYGSTTYDLMPKTLPVGNEYYWVSQGYPSINIQTGYLDMTQVFGVQAGCPINQNKYNETQIIDIQTGYDDQGGTRTEKIYVTWSAQ